MNEPETIRTILKTVKTVAVVGLSDRPGRPSLSVAHYLQQHGYRIVPVNPMAKSRTILGEPVFGALDEASAAVGDIDVVDVFRRPAAVPGVAEDAVAIGAKALWLQLGVINREGAESAHCAGLDVVMDRCLKVEWMRNAATTPR